MILRLPARRASRVALLAALFVAAVAARAHELQPAFLELRETAAGRFEALWKMPARQDLAGGARPEFPREWTVVEAAEPGQSGTSRLAHFRVTAPAAIDGATLRVAGPAAALFDVLVRVARLDGRVQLGRITPSEPAFVVEARPSRRQVAATFLGLGVEHILLGIDHLLFVFALTLLVKHRVMLLKTVTAFTVAHSLTLTAATLGWARVPSAPVEAMIALSILLLAPEILRARRGETSLTIEHPWVVAFAFGLLHGFGFAGALAEVGLPETEVPLALFVFNVGVEAGQLAFIAVLLLALRALRWRTTPWPAWAALGPVYAVGAVAAFWTIERTAAVFAR